MRSTIAAIAFTLVVGVAIPVVADDQPTSSETTPSEAVDEATPLEDVKSQRPRRRVLVELFTSQG